MSCDDELREPPFATEWHSLAAPVDDEADKPLSTTDGHTLDDVIVTSSSFLLNFFIYDFNSEGVDTCKRDGIAHHIPPETCVGGNYDRIVFPNFDLI